MGTQMKLHAGERHRLRAEHASFLLLAWHSSRDSFVQGYSAAIGSDELSGRCALSPLGPSQLQQELQRPRAG